MAYNLLTPKQKAFVDQYLLCLNATQAVRISHPNAKYPDKVGSQYLTHTKIKDAIAEKRNKLVIHSEKKFIVTFEQIADRLWQIAKATPEDETAIKAIGELNKMYGHIAPTKQINQNVNVNIDATIEALKAAREVYKKDY